MSGPARLRIAQIAPLWTSVPPKGYGGAELMVHWLTESLVSKGHEVTLFASADSSSSATLHPVCSRNLIDAMNAGEAHQYEGYANSAIAQAMGRAKDFDVIHCHVGPNSIALLSACQTPVVHTIHAGLDSVDEHWTLGAYPEAIIAAISNSQVATVPCSRHRRITTIYHGCDFSAYAFCARPENYLAFIGRMGPQKNPAGAIAIARAANIPIVLVGQPQNRSERAYFDEAVRPQIDGTSVIHLGTLSAAEKTRFLQKAMALLFPIRWDEHFGLVMIEAMACGTPVIANRRGSVPEVIDNGITGFHSSREEDLVELVGAAADLERQSVYAHAKNRFSHHRMTDDYLRLYGEAIRGGPIGMKP